MTGSGRDRFHPDHPVSIASFILLGTIGVLSFIVQPALVQGFVSRLDLSEAQAVDLAGIEMAAIALATILIAFVGDKTDWRILTVAALVIAATGNLASSWAIGTSDGVGHKWLFAARFLTGFGEGCVISLSFTFVGLTRRTDFNLACYLVVLLAYGAIGLWLAPTLFATIGLEGIFAFFALITAASVLTAPFLPRSGGDSAEDSRPIATAWHRTVVLAPLAGVLIYNLAQGIAWADLFLIGVAAGLSEQAVANALFVSQIIAVGGAIAAITLAERVDRTSIFAGGIFGGIACIALLMARPGATGFLIAVCGFNFLWNMVQPFILAAVNDIDRGGGIMRTAVAMQMIGLAAGPILAARLIDDGDYVMVEAVCIACFAISFVLLISRMRLYGQMTGSR